MHFVVVMRRAIVVAASSLFVAGWVSVVAAQAPPSPPPPAQYGAAATESGKIVGYMTAPEGEMDGFILESGTAVHFPTHAGSRLLPVVHKGDRVSVTGTIQVGPTGQVLEASTVKNQMSGRSVDVPAIPPLSPPTLSVAAPPPPPGAVAPPGEPPLVQPPTVPAP
jgi:hypothetical protein